MRRQAYTVIALLVLVGSMAVAAQAQTGSRTRLVANIPFEFTVGNKTLPAGEYQLRSIAGNSVNAVLLMQDRDCKAETLVQMQTVIGKPQKTVKLIFHAYGNQYFFAEAWVDGESAGLQAAKPKAERAIEHELAGVKPTIITVGLIARR